MSQKTNEEILNIYNQITNLDSSKLFMKNIIYESIKLKTITVPFYKNLIFEIIEKYNPILMSNYLASNDKNRIKMKVHLIYLFLNDYKTIDCAELHIIDDELQRIIYNISFYNFCKECLSHCSSNSHYYNKYFKLIYKYGFDIKYPKMLKMNTQTLKKICFRATTPAKACICCGKFFRKNDTKYHQYITCSKYCHNKLTSRRMSIDNPVHKLTEEHKIIIKKKQSASLKLKILSGEFTPCVTNSWARSLCIVQDKKFRSTWEAYFYLWHNINNITIEYEKIRIQYYDSLKNSIRNYITDFQDFENKIIYEIKPSCFIYDINVLEKQISTEKWCIENKFKYEIITNEWFYTNYDERLLKDVNDIETREKMRRNLNQFSKKI